MYHIYVVIVRWSVNADGLKVVFVRDGCGKMGMFNRYIYIVGSCGVGLEGAPLCSICCVICSICRGCILVLSINMLCELNVGLEFI